MIRVLPVIMVGGSGNRLWPISRRNFPKQFNKLIVQTLKSKKIEQAEKQKKDYRPWGNFESLLTENNFHVKILTVLSGESLSLQKHKFRSENWVVVKGVASSCG